MRKILTLSLVITLLATKTQSQDVITVNDVVKEVKDTTYWYKYLEAGINFSQSSFNDAWKGGGTAATSFSAIINIKSEWNVYRSNFVSDLQMQYGRSNISGIGTRKTIDRIFFDNIYNYSPFNSTKLSFFGSATFQSQFDAGFKYGDVNIKISNFLAPGYLTEGIGMQWKPSYYFTLRVAPIAAKQIFNSDQAVKDNGFLYGLGDASKTVKNNIGINALVKFDKDIYQNVNIKFVYQYFSNYDNLAVSFNRLDLIGTANITKFITVSALATIIYDQTQSTKLQISNLIGLGLTYKIKSLNTL
jgi:hypothetical protein